MKARTDGVRALSEKSSDTSIGKSKNIRTDCGARLSHYLAGVFGGAVMRLLGALGALLAALALSGCDDLGRRKAVAMCNLEATRIYPAGYLEYPYARAFKLCMDREGFSYATEAENPRCTDFLMESCYKRNPLKYLGY